MVNAALEVPREGIAQFCRRNHIRKLALFGSATREDFGPESDVDVLAEFERGHVPSLLGFATLEDELAALMGQRDVDLVTPEDLSPYFRDEVVQGAEPIYAEGRPEPSPSHA